jgi:uncharacterized membrane protein
MEQTSAGRAPFEAVLYPNPPLGDAGLFALMLAVAAVSAGLGAAFALAGAWPVTGFLSVDVLLLWLAFRACRRRARRSELIRLDDSGLYVRRFEFDGRSVDWRFDPYWVRVELDENQRPSPPLVLSASGRALRIGQFLTADERRDLACALREALAGYR